MNDADRQAFLERKLMRLSVMTVQVEWYHLYVSRASDLILQCTKHYISYIEVGTLGQKIYSYQG